MLSYVTLALLPFVHLQVSAKFGYDGSALPWDPAMEDAAMDEDAEGAADAAAGAAMETSE